MKKLEKILRSEIDPAFQKRSRLLLKRIEQLKPQNILDAGCGRGFYLNALTHFSFIRKIHGIDLNPLYIQQAKKNAVDVRVKVQKASIYSLPFPDNTFDAIICSEVLEHLQKDLAGLKELKRVLKKNGTIFITVPRTEFPFLWDPINWILMKFFKTHISKNIWWLAGIWADHERLYTPNQLTSLILNAGMQPSSLSYIHRFSWPFSHFILYGIGKNIIERLKIQSVSRFTTGEKPLATFIANGMKLPGLLDTNWLTKRSSVNLYVEAKNTS